MNFNPTSFGRSDYAVFDKIPVKPKNFDLMKDIAAKLSKGMDFLRVGLYEIDDTVYFSEFTFYPCAGLMPFIPEKYDKVLGDMLEIQFL